ncbi:hypothetical protein LX83_002561 [Goodfellowiella coeruleoviolacea]|uniref:Uncharacterized protein n=2 Tax=Goodfellowiella coeruleoviolacea TaxID=334858 RepID=A0AAE3GGI3_9PSEU|nr:hypothetical protein [Goodfellowiella coeruleoviolacea]
MKCGFVFARAHGIGNAYEWYETLKLEEVDARTWSTEELARRLRPWTLDLLRERKCGDGKYLGFLVELYEDNQFDTGIALAEEEVIWFYESEYLPVGSAA